MADNYLQRQRYVEAESCLIKAATMCPVKFMPLYLLAELYMETNRRNEALQLAQEILNKKIKTPSLTIGSIRNRMQELLNEQDNIPYPVPKNSVDIESNDTIISLIYQSPISLIPP